MEIEVEKLQILEKKPQSQIMVEKLFPIAQGRKAIRQDHGFSDREVLEPFQAQKQQNQIKID